MAMPEPPELSGEEIRRITKFKRYACQARALEHIGVPFRRRLDGSLIVGREAFRRAMEGARPRFADNDDGAAGIVWSKQA